MQVKKWINRGKSSLSEDSITIIENTKNAKYVGDFCIKNKFGGWTEFYIAIFYQENPAEGHNNYFGIYRDIMSNKIMICDGSSAVEGVINAVMTPSGEIIYSRSTHDYRTSQDGFIAVDGGREYTRLIGDGFDKLTDVKLTIVNGKILADGEELPYSNPD